VWKAVNVPLNGARGMGGCPGCKSAVTSMTLTTMHAPAGLMNVRVSHWRWREAAWVPGAADAHATVNVKGCAEPASLGEPKYVPTTARSMSLSLYVNESEGEAPQPKLGLPTNATRKQKPHAALRGTKILYSTEARRRKRVLCFSRSCKIVQEFGLSRPERAQSLVVGVRSDRHPDERGRWHRGRRWPHCRRDGPRLGRAFRDR